MQPHAGSQTNMAVYFACLEPGDTILAMRLDHGGHLTHGHKVNFSGHLYTVVSYGVDRETGLVDFDEVRRLALEHRPKLIVCGASAYPRVVEADRFRAVADEVGALLLCDMAHFAGLVAAGLHPNPTPHCDFVTSTTHKTLAGPRGGFVLCKEEHATALDRAVFPGMQGGPLEHAIAAKATCFRDRGLGSVPRLPGADPRECGRAGRDGCSAAARPDDGRDGHASRPARPASRLSGPARTPRSASHEVAITANRNTVPFDERPPTVASGIRLGTPAVTMRGFDEDDMREVGAIICEALADGRRPGGAARAQRGPLRQPTALPGLPRVHDVPMNDDRADRGASRDDEPPARGRGSPARPRTSSASCGTRRRRRRCSASSSTSSRCS